MTQPRIGSGFGLAGITGNSGIIVLPSDRLPRSTNGQTLLATLVQRLPGLGTVSREPHEVQEKWQRPSTSTVRVAAAQVEALDRLFTFTCRLSVQRFVVEHPFLVPLLVEAYEQIRSYFPSALLYLDVVSDPETGGDAPGSDTEQLVLSIMTDLGVDEAMDMLDCFDHDWWLGALPRSHGDLVVTLEFR